MRLTGETAAGTFQFQAPRCDRVVAAVLAKIAQRESPEAP
jgi:hypothetical protein